MDQAGRKSAESLSVVPVASWARLEPLESLTPEQKVIWREVVASKPSEWFRPDTIPVLEAYCRQVDQYRQTCRLLSELDGSDVKAYADLSKLACQQAGMVKTLATSMRLTQQSRYTPQAASTAHKKAGLARKPWESSGAE